MSYFGDCLLAVMEHESKSQVVLAREAAVAISTIHRILGGMVPTDKTLRQILGNVATPALRIDLVVAWLRDQLESSGIPPEQVVLHPAFAIGGEVQVPQSLAHEFRQIARLAELPEVKAHIVSLADLCVHYKVALAEVYPISREKPEPAAAEDPPEPTA